MTVTNSIIGARNRTRVPENLRCAGYICISSDFSRTKHNSTGVTLSGHLELPPKLPPKCPADSELWRSLADVISDQFESDTPIFLVSCRLSERPRTSANVSGIVGPLTIELTRENAYFYRSNANSKISVTPKLTPTLAAAKRALTRRLIDALREYLWGRPAALVWS